MRAFVAMPFGLKEGIDFNKVYEEYISPALNGAGFVVFRADQETRAGNIRTDMFQELLVADLVVADLSIDNPNVWYELGVRHALRPRGVIQIQCQRDYMPFDVYVDRTLRYHVKDGLPDPERLEKDKEKLATMAKDTMAAWHKRRVSPVYHLLPNLEPPEWKTLRVGEINEHWEALDKWRSRVRVAQKSQRAGDVLVLAEEAPTRVLELESRLAAGEALLKLEQFQLALEQYEIALEMDPDCLVARQKRGILLGRLQRFAEADEWLRKLAQDIPDKAEHWGLLGRVEKDAWLSGWRNRPPGEAREAAKNDAAKLREALSAYIDGFRREPRDYYPGVNALTLACLLEHLTGEKTLERKSLEGGVRWAVDSALRKSPRDYWARISDAELELLKGKQEKVESAFRRAVAVADGDRFGLNSSRQQLQVLRALEFRPAEVNAAIAVLDDALSGLPAEPQPGKVFLFSGHLIDKPDRPVPRFPKEKVPLANAAIERKLEELGAGPGDLALVSGGCGGDLLFAQACLNRGLGLRVRIPFPEPEFLRQSVSFAGPEWTSLFYKVKQHPQAKVLEMGEILGTAPKDRDPFSRNNLWMLYTGLAWGVDRLRFVCLWNGQKGDGPGGTQHMHDTVSRYSGRVEVIDPAKL